MKIALPWPPYAKSQKRILDSLNMWKNKDDLVLCCLEKEKNLCNNYQKIFLERNSSSIGTKRLKCFILDMIEELISIFPNEDWYGFGNSDIVPCDNLIGDHKNKQALVFHRTEILDWSHVSDVDHGLNLDQNLILEIIKKRSRGISDKKIARDLNYRGIKTSNNSDWTYDIIRKMFIKQGEVFFWGQDLFLFRKDIVIDVIKKYLSPKDPILSAGGFDPRLSKWLMDNFDGIRVLNGIFHKRHESEWISNDVDYFHNGGDIPANELFNYYSHTYSLRKRHENDYPVMHKKLINILNKTKQNILI